MKMKDNPNVRRIVIAIAIIPLILVLLYIGGIIHQVSVSYQKWMAEDGMMGNATMDPVILEIPYCLGKAFTQEGLIGILFIIGGGTALIIFAKLNNKFGSKDFDDRNFARSKSGVYGTAGWMTKKEMKSVLEVTSPGNAHGIILGQKNGSVICLPADTMLNKHLCVFGASGTMKSRAIVRPYLFQSIKRGESCVVTDVKGELYNDTAELFRRNGYRVRVFNLINPEHSDSWNAMADLDGDTMMAQVLTNVIISNTGKGKVDHFWDNGEGNLLKSLILYVDQEAKRAPENKHLPAVYQMLTQNSERSLNSLFEKLPLTHPAKAPFNLFAQASETVRAGIILGLGTRLQVLQNEAMKRILSKSELDLAAPGKTKCAYFVIMSDQENSTEFISSLFFSLLFIKMTRYADSTRDLRCKVPVNIVFDEFCNIGQLDTYPRRLSVARSRQIQVCHIAQSLAQFKNRYPEEQWAEIMGCCDTQVMLGCTEEETAMYFSARSGDMTVDVNSTMTVRRTIAVAQMIPQYRHTEGMGKRRVLTPDEVFRLPNDEMLIIIRGQKVLSANKFDFTGHPYAKRIVKASVLDYQPNYKRVSQTETETTQSEAAELQTPDASQNNRLNPAGNGASQTRSSSGDKKASGGRGIYNKHHQTGTNNNQDEAAQEKNIKNRQTETESVPDPPDTNMLRPEFTSNQTESGKYPDVITGQSSSAGDEVIQSGSDTEAGTAHLMGTPSAQYPAQNQENKPSGQTGAGKTRKKPARTATPDSGEPDYSFILESFKPQSQKAPNPSQRDPPKDDSGQIPLPAEMDTRVHFGKPPDCQTETGLHLETPVAPADLPDEINFSSSRYGDDEPPDDF